jgi:hypothetical protein
MASQKKQYQDYGARWAASFGVGQTLEGAELEGGDDELTRQLRLVSDAADRHAAILRALAER